MTADQSPSPSLGRRRFVQGAGVLGAGAALGMRSRPASALTGPGQPPALYGNRFDLRLDRITVNKTGTPAWANAINGGVPGPVLYWREGDVVTINLTNNLPVLTGVHWHGIIIPNPMDGVPGLEFPGIRPGETFTNRFPVVQSGTYWYHSHMGYQEQKGAIGALIIEPKGEPLIKVDRDYVVLLDDWMDGDPLIVANNVKQQGDYRPYLRFAGGQRQSRCAEGEHRAAYRSPDRNTRGWHACGRLLGTAARRIGRHGPARRGVRGREPASRRDPAGSASKRRGHGTPAARLLYGQLRARLGREHGQAHQLGRRRVRLSHHRCGSPRAAEPRCRGRA